LAIILSRWASNLASVSSFRSSWLAVIFSFSRSWPALISFSLASVFFLVDFYFFSVMISASRHAIICSTSIVWRLTIKIKCSVQSNHFWPQLSRSMCVTVDRVWIGEWTYWPLIVGRNYTWQRHCRHFHTLQFIRARSLVVSVWY
jgi:hypothetical protein